MELAAFMTLVSQAAPYIGAASAVASGAAAYGQGQASAKMARQQGEFNAKEVRVGTEAKRFKGYPRDLPVYIVHSGPTTPEYRAEIDAIRLHFRVTREVFV